MATLEQEAFADAPGQSGPVMVGVAGPYPQRRGTVALRPILALPHLVIGIPLGAGASVVAVIGWLAALAVGRLPGFAAGYLSGYTRWTGRVVGYLMLLTDAYPPFSLGVEPGYPVGTDLGPGRLNRLTVAFRLILAVPATIMAGLLTLGSVTVVAFAAWVITLIVGRLPGPLHHGIAAVLRYLIRCHGYVYLLTGVYPSDIFGGISRGAQRIVTLVLILGMLTVAGAGTFAGVAVRSAIARQRAISRLNSQVAAHNAAVARHDSVLSKAQQALAQVSTAATEMSKAQDALNTALDATNGKVNSCASASCFDSLNVTNAKATAVFGRKMGATSLPAGASALVRRLASGTAAYRRSWIYMSRAAALTDVEERARISETIESRFYKEDNALVRWLKGRAGTLQWEETVLDRRATALNLSGAILLQRSAALGVRPRLRTARLSQELVTSAD